MMDAYRMLDRTSQVILVQGDSSVREVQGDSTAVCYNLSSVYFLRTREKHNYCVNKEVACQSALESDALFVPSTMESSAEKKKEQT